MCIGFRRRLSPIHRAFPRGQFGQCILNRGHSVVRRGAVSILYEGRTILPISADMGGTIGLSNAMAGASRLIVK